MTVLVEKNERYECKVCWYCYDPEQGDDVSQVLPGTLFSELPDDWCCPTCEAHKSTFLKIAE